MTEVSLPYHVDRYFSETLEMVRVRRVSMTNTHMYEVTVAAGRAQGRWSVYLVVIRGLIVHSRTEEKCCASLAHQVCRKCDAQPPNCREICTYGTHSRAADLVEHLYCPRLSLKSHTGDSQQGVGCRLHVWVRSGPQQGRESGSVLLHSQLSFVALKPVVLMNSAREDSEVSSG